MKSKILGYLVLAFVSLIAVGLEPVCFAVDVDEASNTVSLAERDLNLAYTAVDGAADSGADVTLLLERLAVAGNCLSEASFAYNILDYAGALSYAVACSTVLDGVVDDAAGLKLSSERAHSDRVLLTAVGSAVGLGLLFGLGFLGWGFLKRSYSNRVLDLKPVSEESP